MSHFASRTILTITFIALIGGLFYVDYRFPADGGAGFNLVVFAAVLLSIQEFYDLAKLKGYTPWAVWGTTCGGLMVLADWLGHCKVHSELHWMGVVAFVFLSGLFILQGWLRPRPEGTVSMALTAMGIVYIFGLAHFLTRIYYLRPDGVSSPATFGVCAVLLTVAVIKAGDIFAYLVGSRWGKHRPFPLVSAKKSWEGYIGGLVASMIVAALLGPWLLKMSWPLALAFAVPVGIAGHLGDLAESVIKRDLGAKDSAVRLPGLGGVLDIVDSLLLGAPVAFYLLEQMAGQGLLS